MNIECGCGHKFADDTVIFEGVSWHIKCAYKEVSKRLFNATQFNHRVVKTLSHFQCAFCDHPVRDSFRFYGNNIYCSTCLTEYLYELGGEGD